MSCDNNCSNLTLNAGAKGDTGAQGIGWNNGAGNPSGTPSDNKIYYFNSTDGSVWKWNGSWSKLYTYTGLTGAFGGYAQEYTFDNTTTSGTALGELRTNNASFASVTKIWLNDQDVNSATTIFTNSDLGVGDKIRLFDSNDSTNYVLFEITNVTLGTGEYNYSVTYETSNGSFSDGDSVVFSPLYVPTFTEDQTHALGVFNKDSSDNVNGTGTLTSYTVDTDNALATLFQNRGDKFNIKFSVEKTASYTDSFVFAVGNTAAVTGYFHEDLLMFDIVIKRVSNVLVNVSYVITQNTTLQSTGYNNTIAVSDLTANNLVLNFKTTASGVTIRNLEIEHVKYISTTY